MVEIKAGEEKSTHSSQPVQVSKRSSNVECGASWLFVATVKYLTETTSGKKELFCSWFQRFQGGKGMVEYLTSWQTGSRGEQ
jgi:hypothetical protein